MQPSTVTATSHLSVKEEIAMKNTKRFITLLLTITMTLIMSQAAWADSFTADGGTYTYNGSDIVQVRGNISEVVDGLEPGDTVTIEMTYTNNSNDTTDWYIRNDVLETLEETVANAKDGGYTYVLTNYGVSTGTVEIFNSDAVGGSSGPDGIDQGLKGATDATGEFFHIDRLEKGQSGKTVLTVGLDPESQANAYENSTADIQLQYAVEIPEAGKTVYKHVKGVKTGDQTRLLVPAAVFVSGLMLLVLAAISRIKDRKDGEKE